LDAFVVGESRLMACPEIITGDRFLLRVIDNIDCQAQELGSYGYQALSQPGSLASNVMVGLLTLFIALFAIRLLFGPAPGARDVVYDMLRIGIVLTLAFSWPAFRTVVHDVVVDGPAQIASAITTPTLSGESERLAVRMQKADNAMVQVATLGTGRNVGATLEGSQTGTSFSGTSLQDDTALGYGRMFYLAGIMGSLVLLRILAAVLLALTPLAAGMLLFEPTRGLFSGWIKGLALAMIGSVGVTLVIAMEMAVLEPWLADVLRVRGLGYAIPSAPIELFAVTAAFAVAQFAMIWLLAKVAFTRGWPTIPTLPSSGFSNLFTPVHPALAGNNDRVIPSRAQRIVDNVETMVRREGGATTRRLAYRTLGGDSGNGPEPNASSLTPSSQGETARLGSSYRRRTARRNSFNSLSKDRKS
jgi:type IV secretion system protein VirB6